MREITDWQGPHWALKPFLSPRINVLHEYLLHLSSLISTFHFAEKKTLESNSFETG